MLDLPIRIEAERLYLRPYQSGDGTWYYRMSQRNHNHLSRSEADNPVITLENEEAAESLA